MCLPDRLGKNETYPKNYSDNLPFVSQLAVDDFKSALTTIKGRAVRKLNQTEKLEETHFIENEAHFKRYAALRTDTDFLIQFIQGSELTIKSL